MYDEIVIAELTDAREDLIEMLKRLSEFNELTRPSYAKRARVEQEAIDMIKKLDLEN